MIDYLGKKISVVLNSKPFVYWKFKRTVDEYLQDTLINYESEKNGLSIVCDSDEKVRSIFIDANTFDQTLFDISFSSTRSEVMALLGKPTISGAGYEDPILGKYGPWDRFDDPHHSIHIQYEPDVDKIKLVTLMRVDIAP